MSYMKIEDDIAVFNSLVAYLAHRLGELAPEGVDVCSRCGSLFDSVEVCVDNLCIDCENLLADYP